MQRSKSLVTVLALVVGIGSIACSEDDTGGGAGTGGSGAGGARAGGAGGSTGSGGAGGSTTGTGGSTSTGGSTGSGGSGGGAGGSSAGSGGSSGDAAGADTSGSETGSADMGATGALTITIDHTPHPTMAGRLCFKKDSTNSGGDKSPKIDWSGVPAGTQSFVLTTYDQTNMTPHQIVCNITPDVMGRPADSKTMIPPGAQSSTGHNKPGNMWYGPGAGDVHAYEIRIWALSTPMLEGGCGASGAAGTRAVYMKLKNAPATLVLGSAAKVLYGNREGACN
jgi:Raf kinase inhibitor-like YbhB/YbcL family protein